MLRWRRAPISNGSLTGTLGTYRYGNGGARPTESWRSSSYFADVVFTAGTPETPAPEVTAKTPTGAAVATDSAITATLSIDVASPSITLASSEGPVAGTSTYDAQTRRITFTSTETLSGCPALRLAVLNAGLP